MIFKNLELVSILHHPCQDLPTGSIQDEDGLEVGLDQGGQGCKEGGQMIFQLEKNENVNNSIFLENKK